MDNESVVLERLLRGKLWSYWIEKILQEQGGKNIENNVMKWKQRKGVGGVKSDLKKSKSETTFNFNSWPIKI